MFVRNVIGVTSLTTRLTTSSTGLKMKFFTSLLQGRETTFCPARQVNMDRCSHTSTQVSRARVNVTILFVQTEVFARLFLNRFLDSLDTSSKSLKYSLNITSLLHGNDTELIFFINPDEECLGSIVEDTTAFRPVPLHTSNLKVSVSRHEEEVVINKLLTDLFIHASKGVVLSL